MQDDEDDCRMNEENGLVEQLSNRIGGLSRQAMCQAGWNGFGTFAYWQDSGKRLPYYDSMSLDQMYMVGFELWRFPIMRAMIEHLVSYCVAKGHKYVPQRKTGRSVPKSTLLRIEGAMEDVMDEVDLGVASGWYLLQEETVRRHYRDGQWFRKFGFYEDGRLWVRFIEPMDIRSPSLPNDTVASRGAADQIRMVQANGQMVPVIGSRIWQGEFGIVSDLNDACNVLGYWRRKIRQNADTAEYYFEPASNIQAGKSGVDMNDPRGIPAFYDVYCHCKQLEEVINAMVELSITQSSFAAIYTHKAATTADALRNIAKQTQKMAQENEGRPSPGQIVHVKGAELELPGMNVRATQYVELIQALQRILGNVYGIPEFMSTGDANTGNRSSLIAAEGPFALRIQREQKNQSAHDVDLMWLAVARKLGWSSSRLASVRASVRIRAEYPTAAIRDWAKEMSVMLDLYKEGVISAQQLNRRMDVDDEQMVYELNVREATPTSSSMGNSQNNPSQAGEMNSAGTQPAVSNTQENDG
jgi:hypothetical protein